MLHQIKINDKYYRVDRFLIKRTIFNQWYIYDDYKKEQCGEFITINDNTSRSIQLKFVWELNREYYTFLKEVKCYIL